MNIHVNGNETELTQPMSLADMLNQRQDKPENYAVAINETFVPRSAYSSTMLSEGDRIELLVPMQGG